MTFERAYKDTLKTLLPTYLEDYNLYISNDISFKPLEKDINGIVIVINTGVGSRLLISGGDYTTLTFSINLIFDVNNLQDVLGSLNTLISAKNGIFETLSLGSTTHDYKATFTNPYTTGSLFELQSKNEDNKSVSMKCVNVVLNITVAYSSNVDFKPSVFKFTVGSTEYTINGIESYDFTSTPLYDSSQELSTSTIKQDKIANVMQYHFKIIAIKNDNLHTLLLSDFFQASTFISSNSTLKLKKDSITAITIQTVIISEMWDKGVKIIDLTLGR